MGNCLPTYKGIRYKSIEELKSGSNLNFPETIKEFSRFESKQDSEDVINTKKEIVKLRDLDGSISLSNMPKFNELTKKIRFLEMSDNRQIQNAADNFINENNLTPKQEKYFLALIKIRESFKESLEEFNNLFNTTFELTELMNIVDNKNNNISEVIFNTQDEVNDRINNSSEIDSKELGIEIEKEYSANELDNFVQKHGSKQTKFIWNLIKNIAESLGIKTRFSFEGKTNVPVGYQGVYAQGQVDIRASLLKSPDSAARVIVHELIHGVTNYIIDAVKNNKTEVLKHLTQTQIKAAKKLSNLLKQLQSDNNTKDFYGSKNEDEILAELTHDGFVEALKNKNLNYVEKVLDYILDILGIGVNAYNEALQILKDLIENPVNYIEKGFVNNNSLYSISNQTFTQPIIDQEEQDVNDCNSHNSTDEIPF